MNRQLVVLALSLVLLLPTAAPAQERHEETAAPAAPEEAADEDEARLRREVDEAMDVLRTYSVERRDEAVARARQATASIDVQIQRLQARIDADWSGMNDDARRRSRSALREIERGRNAAAEWYGGMRHGSSAAWKEVREGFVRSYDELARALRHAREELRDGGRPRPEDDPSSQDAGQKEGS